MLRQIYSTRPRCIHLHLGKRDANVKNFSTRYITYEYEASRSVVSSTDIGRKRGLSTGERSYSSASSLHLPFHAQIVIAGAGTVANSVAYHLVLNGWNDVLVLEQNTYVNLYFTLIMSVYLLLCYIDIYNKKLVCNI